MTKNEGVRLAKMKAQMKRMAEEIHRLKGGLKFAKDSHQRLKEETAPPAERPPGPALKVIPKRRLNVGRWYLGIGRGSNLARWNGKGFVFVAEGEMGYQEKSGDHWDDGPPFGCFQPFEEVDDRKYGLECRYVHDAKSRAKDRAWRKKWRWEAKPSPPSPKARLGAPAGRRP